MWMFVITALFLRQFECFGILPVKKLNDSVQVQTTNGLIQGKEVKSLIEGTYFSYVGIPYAQPPINKLRFKAPKSALNWSGVLDATVLGPCCAGVNLNRISKFDFKPEGQEDCLYLNVFTPRNPASSRNQTLLPVMVFYYGGGFIGGCSDEYGPDYIISNDVILVTSNYRLAAFGFLSTGDRECPGNFGAKDNVAVLKWVHKNIARFGGDPMRVTVFGESAGATLVNLLLLSRSSKGLFQQAILMSGSSLPVWSYQTEQRRIAFDLGVALGIETNNSKILIENLKKVDFNVLAKAQIRVGLLNVILLLNNGLPFTPSVEPPNREALITQYPYKLLESGNFNKVPIMAGVTSLEALTFKPVVSLLKPFLLLYDLSPSSYVRFTEMQNKRRIIGKKIISTFLHNRGFVGANDMDILQLFSDELFWRPLRKTAELLAKHVPVFFYHFAYDGKLGKELLGRFVGQDVTVNGLIKGVGHAEDLSYLFAIKSLKDYQPNKADLLQIQKFSKIITNFAKTGNPTPLASDELLDNLTWPRVTQTSFPYADLDKSYTQSSTNFKENSFRFWSNIIESFADKPYKVY